MPDIVTTYHRDEFGNITTRTRQMTQAEIDAQIARTSYQRDPLSGSILTAHLRGLQELPYSPAELEYAAGGNDVVAAFLDYFPDSVAAYNFLITATVEDIRNVVISAMPERFGPGGTQETIYTPQPTAMPEPSSIPVTVAPTYEPTVVYEGPLRS